MRPVAALAILVHLQDRHAGRLRHSDVLQGHRGRLFDPATDDIR